MPSELPEPIAAYLAAANRRDIDATVASFSEAALVIDESKQRIGRAAVREWIEETTTNYRPQTTVTSVADKGAVTFVAARVAGTFPGSPIDLRYAFTLENDKITRLEIRS